MSRVKLLSVFLLALCAVAGSDRTEDKFKPGPASSYPSRQTNDSVTIAAQALETLEKTRPAFGKADLNKYGVLPVLLVMENASGLALRLEDMKVELVLPDRTRLEPTPANEVKYMRGGRQRRTIDRFPNPLPYPVGRGGGKNPLDVWEIEGRAFAVRMLPAGESANGFLYFQASYRPGMRVYITGIRQAGAAGKELFYFEIPLDSAQ